MSGWTDSRILVFSAAAEAGDVSWGTRSGLRPGRFTARPLPASVDVERPQAPSRTQLDQPAGRPVAAARSAVMKRPGMITSVAADCDLWVWRRRMQNICPRPRRHLAPERHMPPETVITQTRSLTPRYRPVGCFIVTIALQCAVLSYGHRTDRETD